MKRLLASSALLAVGMISSSGISWGAHPAYDPSTFSPLSSQKSPGVIPAQAKPEPPPGPISGKILQSMDSGGYTYLLIDTKGERRWAAITSTPVKVGERVTVKPGTMMYNFSSKGLNRTFDRIVFSEGIEQSKATPKVATPKSSTGSSGAAVPFTKISVEKAPGSNGYRIVTLYENVKLDGKKISVRGKVVKVSSGIMDRNWIHLQDGTGSPEKKNHNLVVTSKELPDVGDIVLVTGIVVRNKDFGSGYKYDVIMEKAKIVKQP